MKAIMSAFYVVPKQIAKLVSLLSEMGLFTLHS